MNVKIIVGASCNPSKCICENSKYFACRFISDHITIDNYYYLPLIITIICYHYEKQKGIT